MGQFVGQVRNAGILWFRFGTETYYSPIPAWGAYLFSSSPGRTGKYIRNMSYATVAGLLKK